MTLAAMRAVDPPHPPSDQAVDPRTRRLSAAALSGSSPEVARSLLGVLLVRDDGDARRVVRIVETEAYAGPIDRASHARVGRTPRTDVMFGPTGRAYVYLVYGMHHCINVVCGPTGEAGAVLLRAAEPLSGLGVMRSRRGAAAGADPRLAAGPGRLCQALDIDRSFSGVDLLSDERLWLAEAPAGSGVGRLEIAVGPRIGVDYAGPDWAGRPWRFGIVGHPALSRPFPVGA